MANTSGSPPSKQQVIKGLTPSQRMLLEARRAGQAQTAGHESPHGIREKINRHPLWSVGGIAILLAAWLLFEFRPAPVQKASYTIDDGQTFFSRSYVVPPFDYEGKEAVQAVMFTCGHGSTPFCGYLLRFKPEAKAKLEADIKSGAAAKNRGPMDMSGAEVKRPGDATWVGNFDPRETGKRIQEAVQRGENPRAINLHSYNDVTLVKCPDGKMAIPVGAD